MTVASQDTLAALITRAREATSTLRDAAREGRIIDFRKRDPLVAVIHEVIDLAEKQVGETAPVPSSLPSQNPSRRAGHDSSDWVERVAADIRDLNPDYHDFEGEVARLIRASSPLSPEPKEEK